MRKVEFWVGNDVKNKNAYFVKKASSLMTYNHEEEKYYFNSKFGSTYEINVSMRYLDFSTDGLHSLVNLLGDIYFRAKEEAKKNHQRTNWWFGWRKSPHKLFLFSDNKSKLWKS